MPFTVLILSSPDDAHAKCVESQLVELGVPCGYWRPKDLLTESSLSFSFNNQGFSCELTTGEASRRLDLETIQSVWYRRPGTIKSTRLPEPWMESLAQRESTQAIEGIFRILRCLWVNHPARQKEALLKIPQLEKARKLGFLVPDTIVTNTPEKVAQFYEQHKGEIIYKLVDSESGSCFPLYELPRSIPTMPFRESDLAHLGQVSTCLHLFQERIEKVSDLRVTVVGKKIFAVEIESQAKGRLLDWRFDHTLPMKTHSLPADVEAQCFQLMQELGLEYAALDFCINSSGQYVFLEINPHGQYLWLEEALNIPISRELARLLAGLEAPLIG